MGLDPNCAKANANQPDAGCFTFTENKPEGPWLACKEKCKENPTCKSWTLKYSNPDPYNCYLKTAAPLTDWTQTEMTISGHDVKECLDHESGSYAIGDCDTKDLDGKSLGHPKDWSDCAYACRDAKPDFGGCESWSYVNGECWGKKGGMASRGFDFCHFTKGAYSGPKAQ